MSYQSAENLVGPCIHSSVNTRFQGTSIRLRVRKCFQSSEREEVPHWGTAVEERSLVLTKSCEVRAGEDGCEVEARVVGLCDTAVEDVACGV